MHEIVTRNAQKLGVPAEALGAREIARRARGTPRVANRLLRRARDFAEVEGDGTITLQPAIPRYQPQTYPPEMVRIQGELVASLSVKYPGR